MQLYHNAWRPTGCSRGDVRAEVQDCAGFQARSCRLLEVPRRTKETTMYSPRGRTGRMSGGTTPIVAAVAIALMGMGGVAFADPKVEPGPPEQAQGNGPAPPAHDNAPP